jgi:hypothetical protein
MFRRLRVALIWLLVAALPVQAFAAASMATCGLGHGLDSAPSVRHDGVVAFASVTAMPAMHHHVHAFASGAPQISHAGHGAAHAKSAASKCSVCASCCTSLAIAPSFHVFEAVPQTEFFAPLGSVGSPTFLTAGPERPPRPFLA